MTTQYLQALAGTITPEMTTVATRENIAVETVREQIAAGRLVIPANRLHLAGLNGGVKLQPCAIGRAVTTKINANIGASPNGSCKTEELLKLQWAVKYGADAVMDLSTGGDLDDIRAHLIANSPVPIGTVPLYSMIVDQPIEDLTPDKILEVVEHQAKQGVDFFTIHAGLLKSHLAHIPKRKMGICSRGGSLIAKWMTVHNRENPFYELFDEISAIMLDYDVSYSLGDGLRPGCLADASDDAQFAELDTLGELVFRSRELGVQCMVEGPGHVPYDQIEMNMKRQQEVCDHAPFYVLGPLVTDAFPGYDHITSAIGATAAAVHGASFLCYVTPTEHHSLPEAADVREGCVAYKIAAHAADVARGLPGARDWDYAISDARANFDWDKQLELAFDSERAAEIRNRGNDTEGDRQHFCSMCGHDWCAVRISKEVNDTLRERADTE